MEHPVQGTVGGAKKDCYHSFLVTVVIISHSEIAHTLVTVPHFPLPLFFFLPAISKPSFLSFYTSTFSGKHAFVWQVFFFFLIVGEKYATMVCRRENDIFLTYIF